jgi:hypothetical protein
MPVQIFTTVVNRPQFVDYQARLFKKYLREEYQFHVVDDSVEPHLTCRFEEVCAMAGASYHRHPNRYPAKDASAPSAATAAVIQWTFDEIIKKRYADGVVMLLDSDMFLVDDLDVSAYIRGSTIGGLWQKRGHVTYIWNGLMIFNMPEIMRKGGDLDFSCGVVEGCATDTGGHLYYFVHRDGVTVRATDPNMEPAYPRQFKGIDLHDFGLTNGYKIEAHCDAKFLHYRSASNWFGEWRSAADPLEGKTRIFEHMLMERL